MSNTVSNRLGNIRNISAIGCVVRLVLLTGPLFADSMPPPARKVTLSAEPHTPAAIAQAIKEQTGTAVDVSAIDAKAIAASFQKLDLWLAIEQLADKTNSRVVVNIDGNVSLKPGKSLSGSCVSGPFRFSPRGVFVRGDPTLGTSNYVVSIDLTWEPWLHTYRIDGIPRIDSVVDDAGKSLTVTGGRDRSLTGPPWKELSVRPQGITRSTKSLTIRGSVMVTIADKLLTFTFDAATGKPIGDAVQDGVSMSVSEYGAEGNDWVAKMRLQYPKSDVIWESFEFAWQRNNLFRMLPPKGAAIEADIVEAADLRYGLKGKAKQVGPGWKFDYRTPGPMREIIVPFELKDIKLP